MGIRSLGGLPLWSLRFDSDGDPDPAAVADLLAGLRARGVTDLVAFAHGWNSDRPVADALYEGFFGLLADQARRSGPWAEGLGLVGVHWPARRWPDEPTPDFGPGPVPVPVGAAATNGPPRPAGTLGRPGLDPATLHALADAFPTAAPTLRRLAQLLHTVPTAARVATFAAELRRFATTVAAGFDDSESAAPPVDSRSADPPVGGRRADEHGPALPRMLDGDPIEVYARFLDGLRTSGLSIAPAAVTGAAGLTSPLSGIWYGAREALRQVTYWQMKNRAGVIGRYGLGPVLARLPQVAPGIRVHLVGHSFGARLVSFAAAALPAGAHGPVRSVTLLQAAFSQFAFAPVIPYPGGRAGALAGLPARIDGPLTVCYSAHDAALGIFYPLASLAAGDDAAALAAAGQRFGALGFHGARAVSAARDPVAVAGRRGAYRFAHRGILNVDAAAVVRRGGPPSGAHSDIVHPELAWLVLAAAHLV
ncbi:hypothetical protein ACN27F_01960 [Solwaraspora sp. WMMB335]|uniref:hypothetical protein n=1 Tax=Solwaraspora sp. WMMB335 TaxID=3404118 RepID=UPI003B92D6AB